MTVGTTSAKHHPTFQGHGEVILYRTRTEILTDKRILLDGTNYTFDQIEAVDVVRLKYTIPFQILRLLALIGALACAWMAFGSFRDADFTGMVVPGIIAAVLGALTLISDSMIPSHAIRLKVHGKSVYIMHDNSRGYLKEVQAAIHRQMNQRR